MFTASPSGRAALMMTGSTPRNFEVDSGAITKRLFTSSACESAEDSPRIVTSKKLVTGSFGDAAHILLRRKLASFGSFNLEPTAEFLSQNPRLFALVFLNLSTEPISKKFWEFFFGVVAKEKNLLSFLYCANFEEFSATLKALSFLGDDAENKFPSRISFIFYHETKSTTPIPDADQLKAFKDLVLKATNATLPQFLGRNIFISAPLVILDSDPTFRTDLSKLQPNAIFYGETESKLSNAAYEAQKQLTRFMLCSTILWVGKSSELPKAKKPSFAISASSSDGSMSSISKFGYRAFVQEAKLRGICVTRCTNDNEILDYLKLNAHQTNNPRFRIILDNRIGADVSKTVEKIRTKYLVPILVVGLEAQNTALFDSTRTQVTTDFETIRKYVDTLCAVKWAPNLTVNGTIPLPWEGTITISHINFKNLCGKAEMNFVCRLNKSKWKTSNFGKSPDVSFNNLEWKLPANSSDTLKLEICSTDFRGDVEATNSLVLGQALGLVSADDPTLIHSCRFLALKEKKGKSNVIGLLTMTMQFSSQAPTKVSALEPSNDNFQRKFFGRTLEEAVAHCDKTGTDHIAVTLMNFLFKYALNEQGLIRVPGNKCRITELRDEFDGPKGVNISFKRLGMESPFDVAGLLKLYLYELPDALITHKAWKQLDTMDFDEPRDVILPQVQNIFDEIPDINFELFSEMCFLFAALIERRERTLLDAKAIAVSIGPTLLLCPQVREDPVAFLSASNRSGVVLQFIIENASVIFGWILDSSTNTEELPEDTTSENPTKPHKRGAVLHLTESSIGGETSSQDTTASTPRSENIPFSPSVSTIHESEKKEEEFVDQTTEITPPSSPITRKKKPKSKKLISADL